jgi:hypothetical protein
MKERRISLPELGLIAGTRGALGFGLGLLLADRFGVNERRAVGWTLTLVGLISTVPLAVEVLTRPGLSPEGEWAGRTRPERALSGVGR